MTKEEIKRRQMTGQHLLTPSDKMTVLHDLMGVQAQFMTNAYHSLFIRCHDHDERSLKDGLTKNWTIRGTVHVFSEEDLPLFLHCENGTKYRSNDWCGYRFWNQRDKWALSPERQAFFSDVILDALAGGEKTRNELKNICRENGITKAEEDSMFDSWGGGIRELCERGFCAYTAEETKRFCLSPPFTPIPEEDAKLEMARRYFTHYGPATVHDAMYFFHAPAREVKNWLSLLPVRSAECEGRTYYYIENGMAYDHDIPECLFLAGFDPLMLGYQKKESLYLDPENMRGIFNLAGIVMPVVLFRGKVIGKWKKKNEKLDISLFCSMGEQEKTILRDSAEALWGTLRAISLT